MSERFGNYELLEQLASGGMARVFRARMVGAAGFEKIVALKFMLPGFKDDPESVKMFIDEARLAATLSHANIVGIIDFGEKDGEYFLAMEYVSGANLRVILRRSAEIGRLAPVTIASRIVAEVALGLDYAHRRTDAKGNPLFIVHRDISPQNIVVSWNGDVKILDFGIARSSARQIQTAIGTIKGKYSYMSPEQARGQAVDHRSDLFSLGSVFYEILSGERAFPNPGLECLEKVRRCDFVPLLEKKPDAPPKLAAIVTKAMAADPESRYESAGALVEDLALWLAEARVRGERGGDASSVAKWVEDLFAASSADTPMPAADPAKPSAVLSGWENQFPAGREGAEHKPRVDLTFSASDSEVAAEEEADVEEGTAISSADALIPTKESPSAKEPEPPAIGFLPRGAGVPTNPGVAPARPPVREPSSPSRSEPARPDFAAVAREIGKSPTPRLVTKSRVTRDPAPAAGGGRGAMLVAGAVALLGLGAVGSWAVLKMTAQPSPTPTPTPIAIGSRAPSATPTAAASAASTSTAVAVSSATPEAGPTLIAPLTIDRSAKPIGIMNISSVPPGAEVLLNGKHVAEAPVLVPNLLAPGTYLIDVHKDGYAPWSKEVELQDDTAVEIVATLATPQVPGRLVLPVPNAVRCFLDGHLVGTGPKKVNVDVQPGSHQVKLRAPDGTMLRDYEVLITAGHVSELDVPPTL